MWGKRNPHVVGSQEERKAGLAGRCWDTAGARVRVRAEWRPAGAGERGDFPGGPWQAAVSASTWSGKILLLRWNAFPSVPGKGRGLVESAYTLWWIKHGLDLREGGPSSVSVIPTAS